MLASRTGKNLKEIKISPISLFPFPLHFHSFAMQLFIALWQEYFVFIFILLSIYSKLSSNDCILTNTWNF